MKKVISLFSGAGGLDLGFHAAGFDIAVCIEEDPACCSTLRKNAERFLTSPVIIENDIRKVSSGEILKSVNLKPLEAALVIGGPPCQSFSLAGARKGFADPRGQLVKEFIRVVRDTLPVAFVMENVKGMLNWSGGEVIRYIEDCFLEEINFESKTYKYSVKHSVLNAANFGVPQLRERVFIVGNRIGVDFKFPKPTHSAGNSELCSPVVTVNDAIGNLPPADAPSSVAMRVAGTIKGRIKNHGY